MMVGGGGDYGRRRSPYVSLSYFSRQLKYSFPSLFPWILFSPPRQLNSFPIFSLSANPSLDALSPMKLPLDSSVPPTAEHSFHVLVNWFCLLFHVLRPLFLKFDSRVPTSLLTTVIFIVPLAAVSPYHVIAALLKSPPDYHHILCEQRSGGGRYGSNRSRSRDRGGRSRRGDSPQRRKRSPPADR